MEKKQLRESFVRTIRLISHNVRGLQKDEYVEEMLAWIRTLKGVYAACLQETWKLGDTVEENTGCVLLNHGPEVKLCKRGSLGVAILLSPSAQKAWEKAGSLIKCANYLFQHLKAFGLLMHIGRGATASKTEAVFFPKPHQPSTSGDQTDFNVDGDGFISFSTEFKYLGSIIHNSLTSDSDIETRITKATAAFGALRKCFFDSKLVSLKDKGKVYSILCLTILLYGSECWSLREDMFNRLRVFHNTCVRSMCRVTMHHVIRHHITDAQLRERVGVKDLDHYYNTRLLRWVGHVARMNTNRLPRKLLTCWVRNKRPVGAPQMTYGRTVNKALNSRGITTNFVTWKAIAEKRVLWRKKTRG